MYNDKTTKSLKQLDLETIFQRREAANQEDFVQTCDWLELWYIYSAAAS